MLQPWIDVGKVGTLAFTWLESHFGAKELGKLAKPGNFFDFTRYRPTVYTRDDQRQIRVPNIRITYAVNNSVNDFLFFHLLEPHNHSEDYIDAILWILEKLKVKRYYLIGSMFDYVPHTRPLVVTGSTPGNNNQQESKRTDIRRSNYQGPTTITSLISHRISPIGVETMSLIVHLPQYAQLEEDYIGTVRILEILGSLYGFSVDVSYINNAERQKEQLDSAVEKNRN